jgi:NADH-quinone oxidoreductase subunit J
MTVELILFLGIAVVAMLAAIAMLVSQNAVYSAIFLVVNFLAIAILFLLLNAAFIALVQVTVYAGAIMVLFLFVVMLLGAERVEVTPSVRWQTPVAMVLGIVLLLEFVAIIIIRPESFLIPAELVGDRFGDPASLAKLLFNEYLLPFEITSVVLLVAMVGAIVITRDRKGGSQ